MRRGPSRLVGSLPIVLLLFAGCASTPESLVTLSDGLAAERARLLVAQWDADWRAFEGLRAAVDLTVTRRGRTQRGAGALVLSPSQLRFEAIAPFGLPVLVVTAGPDQIVAFSPGERRAWVARPTSEAAGRLLGVPLRPDTLIRLLAGQVPLPPDPAALRVIQDRVTQIAFERDGIRHRVSVTAQGFPVQLVLENGGRVTATFERNPTGALEALGVEASGQSLTFHLRYLSAEPFAPPREAFELLLPVGVPVERVD